MQKKKLNIPEMLVSEYENCVNRSAYVRPAIMCRPTAGSPLNAVLLDALHWPADDDRLWLSSLGESDRVDFMLKSIGVSCVTSFSEIDEVDSVEMDADCADDLDGVGETVFIRLIESYSHGERVVARFITNDCGVNSAATAESILTEFSSISLSSPFVDCGSLADVRWDFSTAFK